MIDADRPIEVLLTPSVREAKPSRSGPYWEVVWTFRFTDPTRFITGTIERGPYDSPERAMIAARSEIARIRERVAVQRTLPDPQLVVVA